MVRQNEIENEVSDVIRVALPSLKRRTFMSKGDFSNHSSDVNTTTFIQYPVSSVFIYNGTTTLHYILGSLGIVAGYQASVPALVSSIIYLLFALFQMYLLMPLTVCPNCVYYRIEDALCVSGMNLFSRKLAKQGDLNRFADRSKGIFCHNNLYMAALLIPILAMLPALFINFTYLLLFLFLSVLALLLFRIFIIFPKIACVHCAAKKGCPNAINMGIS